jgi:hypothetical protein
METDPKRFGVGNKLGARGAEDSNQVDSKGCLRMLFNAQPADSLSNRQVYESYTRQGKPDRLIHAHGFLPWFDFPRFKAPVSVKQPLRVQDRRLKCALFSLIAGMVIAGRTG